MAQAPSVVGAKLWQQCIDRQREEAAQRKRQADAELAASPLAKRLHQAMNSIADQYVCKITHELPIHPVTAEDGLIYEENAICQWFETKKGDNEPPTSPATGVSSARNYFRHRKRETRSRCSSRAAASRVNWPRRGGRSWSRRKK